ncbi:RagB/SusD family nutrient uptake outer membrane protein [uncultured Bacteroides sp.]|jgi:hypothetical protein|uniref:RagB/SusD family nutrient uptake outer membrane protein n=1 Tax=uncultured Bacteroides sp. TaxID=162156 RepID=UPI00258DDCE2|nr:RagB/SusD family nutrient uptake outer membrane protein [uncultured Bacteroides sp.]
MKLNKLIYGILTVTVLSACADKMEYHEYNNYDEDYVKLNFGNVGGLITDIYLKLDTDFGNYNGAMLASATDEAEYAYTSNDIVDFYDGSWSPINAKSSMWSTCYEGIANCNHYLEKFTGLTFPELELNDDYIAQMGRYNNYPYEVRFLRAYFYFNLVRQYGDVPFTDHMLDAEESNALSRRPAQEIFDYIISECDEIKDLIIEDYSKVDRPIQPVEGGRANKLTVLALKARAALFAASPLFNPTNDSELWHRAALANMEVVNACEAAGMMLIPNYETLWAVKNYSDGIQEIIFGRRANRATSTTESNNYPAGLTGSKGGNCPTQTLVDAYEMKDTGLRWDEEGSGYEPNNPYEGRDPRFELTIAHNGSIWPKWNETPLQTYQGGLNGQPITGGTPTGYYLKKLCHGDIDLRDNSTNKSDNHTWVTFRLGEFYLNYAEALFKYLGGADETSSEFVDNAGKQVTAREMASKTRVRVGMPVFPVDMTKDEFWKKYQNERMVELAFEGHRFWDVRRWKEADKFFTSINVMKITNNGDSYAYNREPVARMWDDKMYLFPIPRTEIMKNPNLTQNPGW